MESYKKITPVFVLIGSIFISTLIVSNIIAVKLISIFGIVLPAAVIVFPITYIFGDILTEVYGFRRARMVIWLGFFSNFVVVIFIVLAQILPSASVWKSDEAFSQILGFAPRVLIASFTAYLFGEFSNSIVLSRVKIFTKGKFLWIRTISSTLIGEFLDSFVFITIAFIGLLPLHVVLRMAFFQWAFKVLYEIAATPVTYLIVGIVKKKEGIDTYDYRIKYNPLKLFGN